MVLLEVGDGEDEGAHAEAEGPAQSDHPPALPTLHNHRVPGHGVAHCALWRRWSLVGALEGPSRGLLRDCTTLPINRFAALGSIAPPAPP